MTDAIANDSYCMGAYGRIIDCLYSLPSAENSTIFKLLACLPSFVIDIQERVQFLQDLYDMVKQKMMNTNQNDGSAGINWNQVLMELTTIMHRVEENIETNELQAMLALESSDDMNDQSDEYRNYDELNDEMKMYEVEENGYGPYKAYKPINDDY